MYAGAVRETVFAVPQVIRKVNAEFIPLALKAALVNGVSNSSDKDEAWVYAGIKRIMLAPQGIGILNSHGQPLEWVQMFDNDPSVLDFFDAGLKHFKDAETPVVTRRHMKFPSQKLDDMKNDESVPSLAEAHAKDKWCSATTQAKGFATKGEIVAQVVGRALDKDGKPVADTIRQENYIQDQFGIPLDMQAELAKSIVSGVIPKRLGRLWATHVYLGHIDVRPISNPAGGEADSEEIEFSARRDGDVWRVEGKTSIEQTKLTNGEGRHDVKLAWEGFIEMKGDRITSLVLMARGTERLKFGNEDPRDEVSRLPAGRQIDISCDVVYGIIGTPSTREDTRTPDEKTGGAGSFQQKMERFQRALQTRLQKLMNEGRVQEAGDLLDGLARQLEERIQPRQDGPMPRLQQKMQKLQGEIQRWQKAGRDPTPIGKVMEKFEPLMKGGEIDKAEALLDEALKLASEEK